MISAEFIEMSRAAFSILANELYNLGIGEKIDTLWCDGYNIYLEPYWYNREEAHAEIVIQRLETPLKNVKKPFIIYLQEDLQAIALNHESMKGFSSWWIMVHFMDFYEKSSLSVKLDLTSVWLAFVMETCYGKRWDSDKREWVKKED